MTAVLVGCGHRSRVYTEIAFKFPEQLKIVALVDACRYSAKMMILENPHYLAAYPWQCTGKEESELTLEEKIHSLKTDNPHGVCVYKSGATVVDHQTVIMQFENGSTASHSMLCSAQRAGRSLYVLGTQGRDRRLDRRRKTLRQNFR